MNANIGGLNISTDYGLKNIVINSANKNPESISDSDFYIDISGWPRRPKGICVESVQMFSTQYTINQNNNLLRWTDSADEDHITELTKGNYTQASLATHVQEKLAADDTSASDVYSVTYDIRTGKMTFANDSANFGLNFSVKSRSAAGLLGFNAADISGAQSHIGNNVVNLANKYFTIHADAVHNTTYSAVGNLDDVIAFCPNDVLFGDIINFKSEFRKLYPVVTELNRIHIIVRDDSGQVAQLNGVPWSMVLVLTY